MNNRKIGYYAGLLLIGLLTISSCHEDISTIGSEIIGDEEPHGILDDSHTIIAYSKKINSVQTNRLESYRLGFYNDPVFGTSTSNFVSQVVLPANNPIFGDNARVDSVFVYIPFYSTEIPVDTTVTYKLDSIYGNTPINISVYESGYYLRDFDPSTGFEEIQPYYSNQGQDFDNFIGSELGRIENFKPSKEGFVIRKGEDNQEKIAPGLRIALSKDYFQNKIIDKEGSDELRNNNNFRNYLRGLYFKVDVPNNEGNLFFFDASDAKVTIHYSNKNDEDEWAQQIFEMNFGGVSVNLFENSELPSHILSDLANADTINGSENLYLQGGEGVLSVIKLFGEDNDNNGVADELELLRAKKWLINEASLKLYVNQNMISGGSTEPDRISIYNLNTNNVLIDYMVDPTNGLPPANAFNNHLEPLERGIDNKGKYYKLRITNHISNLINKDSLNVPLGIVVSQNVKNLNFQKVNPDDDINIRKIPASGVMSPKSTILYGNSTLSEENKLKLQIYYTEPN